MKVTETVSVVVVAVCLLLAQVVRVKSKVLLGLHGLLRKTEYSEDGNEVESEWWWAKDDKTGDEGYVPRNFLGMWPRIQKVT